MCRACAFTTRRSALPHAIRTVALISLTFAPAVPILAQDVGIEVALPPDPAYVESAPSHSSTAWQDFLDGRVALGAGMTYQYDGSKGTTLGLATYTWRDDHYELAAFRFLTAQTRLGHALSDPNWVFEVSRRWQLIDRSGVQLFFGGGAAYKSNTDDLNGSHLNFAEQLGWRFPRQVNGGEVEFAIRHISNAGLKKPNKGEDFLTLAYVF